ncbi:MAG: lipopolysaccharide heptosyltransferase II [Geobacteraceae bacterium]|nr:lipopolysaccharide heptosyltransferase II [Geobacteraceae bacterium]
MTTPALAVIREQFPGAEIVLLANPLVSALFLPHPAIDRVITFDRNGRHRGVRGRFLLARELRRERFDCAIILPNSFDSALVPWLAGIPRRFGKKSDGRSLLLSDRFVPANDMTEGHEVEYYLHLLRSFGITGRVRQPYLTTTAAEQAEAIDRLAQAGIAPGDILLGINPGAAFGSAKRWLPERFAEVAQRLSNRWGAKIIIFGGSGEADIVSEISAGLQGKCLGLAGRTSVRQLMALIQRCSFFITNDSGPMHIASAFDVPLVAIFGSTDHTGTAPCSARAVIVRKDFDCAPCKLRECPTDHRCMTAVTADDVVQAAQQLFAEISGPESKYLTNLRLEPHELNS